QILVCIDFTHPEAVIDNIRQAAKRGQNIVVGTTGWSCHFLKVKKVVADAAIGMLHSPNFSIGAHLHKQITAYAAALIKNYKNYHATISETHHTQKVDKPSGTALSLKKELEIDGAEIPVTSYREGINPGNHTVTFDSSEDAISIIHQA